MKTLRACELNAFPDYIASHIRSLLVLLTHLSCYSHLIVNNIQDIIN